MCMFDKMFEEGGHKFRKRSPKDGPTVTNPRVTSSYNPFKDRLEQNFYEDAKDWRILPPSYKLKTIQEHAEQIEDEKPFSYLTFGQGSNMEAYYDSLDSDSETTLSKKKKIKKSKHKGKHTGKHKDKHKDNHKDKRKDKRKDKHMNKKKHKSDKRREKQKKHKKRSHRSEHQKHKKHSKYHRP